MRLYCSHNAHMHSNDLTKVYLDLCRQKDEMLLVSVNGKINQTALADGSGVPQPTISRILKGGFSRNIGKDVAIKLSRYLGVPVGVIRGERWPLKSQTKRPAEYESDNAIAFTEKFRLLDEPAKTYIEGIIDSMVALQSGHYDRWSKQQRRAHRRQQRTYKNIQAKGSLP